MEVWKPNVLLLGAGGIKGFLTVGSLLFFEKTKMLKDIKKIVGISIGSVIGLLYVVGYSMTEILEFALMTQLSEIVSNIDIVNIMKTNGFISHDILRKKINDKIISKFGFVPTFKQLYLMTGYHLEVVVTNLDENKAEYFSHETQPDLPCVEAILMSMSLPLFFQTYIHNEKIYIDGAISDPFPLYRYEKDRIFGILLKTTPTNPKESFFTYLTRVIDSFASTKEKNIIIPSNCKILRLEYQVSDTVGIKMSFENRVDMVLFGYLRGYQFYEELHKIHPNEYPINIQKTLSKEFFKSLPEYKKEDERFFIQHIDEISQVDSDEMENEGDDYLMEIFESSDLSEDWSSESTDQSSDQDTSSTDSRYSTPQKVQIKKNIPTHEKEINITNHNLSNTVEVNIEKDELESQEDEVNIERDELESQEDEVKIERDELESQEESKDQCISNDRSDIEKDREHLDELDKNSYDKDTIDNEMNMKTDIDAMNERLSCRSNGSIENRSFDLETNVGVVSLNGESIGDKLIREQDSFSGTSPLLGFTSVVDEFPSESLQDSLRMSQSKNKTYSPSRFKKWKKTKKKHKTPEWIAKK